MTRQMIANPCIGVFLPFTLWGAPNKVIHFCKTLQILVHLLQSLPSQTSNLKKIHCIVVYSVLFTLYFLKAWKYTNYIFFVLRVALPGPRFVALPGPRFVAIKEHLHDALLTWRTTHKGEDLWGALLTYPK